MQRNEVSAPGLSPLMIDYLAQMLCLSEQLVQPADLPQQGARIGPWGRAGADLAQVWQREGL
jgi:hypothetical protein